MAQRSIPRMDRERRLRRACPRVHGAAAEHEPQHSVATACVMQKEGVLKLRRDAAEFIFCRTGTANNS